MTVLGFNLDHQRPALTTLLWITLVTLPLMACSYVESKPSVYKNSPHTAPLVVPAGLDTPTQKSDYALPTVSPTQGQQNTNTQLTSDPELMARPPHFIPDKTTTADEMPVADEPPVEAAP